MYDWVCVGEGRVEREIIVMMNTKSTIKRQYGFVKKEWNNKGYKSFGIEKTVRLLLVILPFLDLGLYLRNCFQGEKKLKSRKIATDAYVVLNMLFPLMVLYFGWYNCKIVVWICFYFGVMTLLVLLSMSFLLDLIPRAMSNQRNVICLFLNYCQIVFLFAVLYLGLASDGFGSDGEIMKLGPLKAIYLSLEVFTSVGFGDVVPLTSTAYKILIVQMFVQVIFVYLLFVIFIGRQGDSTFYNRKSK